LGEGCLLLFGYGLTCLLLALIYSVDFSSDCLLKGLTYFLVIILAYRSYYY
jgi:hypothetical protein